MEDKLGRVAEQLKDSKTKELRGYISNAYTELVETKINMIIPEIVFKEYFLEFFYGMTKKETDSPLALKWIELSGGPYNEVDVVDDLGNIIYSVPSLFTRPEVNADKLKGLSFGSMYVTFKAKTNRTEADGINYLNRELSSLPKSVETDSNLDVNRWLAIFQRYATKPTTGVLPKTLQNDEIELNYD